MTGKQPENFELPSRTGLELPDIRQPIAYSFWPAPIHKLCMMSMVWSISIGQLG